MHFLKDFQLLCNSTQDFERVRKLLPSVSCGNDGADARLTDGYRRIADALREHALLEELAGEFVGQRCIADDDRRDRRCHARVHMVRSIRKSGTTNRVVLHGKTSYA